MSNSSQHQLIELFINKIAAHYSINERKAIERAIHYLREIGEHVLTPLNVTCLVQGLKIAEKLLNLDPDVTAINAALLYPLVEYAGIDVEMIAIKFSNEKANLISGVIKMNELRLMQQNSADHSHNHQHVENIRKMLVTMVEDTRVVLIKLAERAYYLDIAETLTPEQQLAVAQETMTIYAPLANRLGVSQLKWQLEDFSFRYLQPDVYQTLRRALALNQEEHFALVQDAIQRITQTLNEHGVHQFSIIGRVKHIYSIYKKMQRKKVPIEEIYDVLAIRIHTQTVEDCYTALSHVHTLWEQIPKEFDDYIATPKANGYQSLHTVVIGPEGKNLEVQIRTEEMHKHAEMGVAAHWHYKQGGKRPTHEGRIAWLRQVLEWEKELDQQKSGSQPVQTSEKVSSTDTTLNHNLELPVLDERVYVFTPTGEIKELPRGATPLDFAYQIHSEVGHRCRGAKVNGSIVPLTYVLKTSDQVEILTAKLAHPSRDWMNPHFGYLYLARSRAKVQQWFKQQDHAEHVQNGQTLLQHELQRLNLTAFDLNILLPRLHFSNINDIYAAVGNGDLRTTQIVNMIQTRLHQQDDSAKLTVLEPRKLNKHPEDCHIDGVGNLLTNIARCCQPIPGDTIVGFITRGRGITIHRQDCSNILYASEENRKRLIEIAWGLKPKEHYPVEIVIEAYDRHGLIRDITVLLSHEKVNVLSLMTSTDKAENSARIILTIEILDLSHLSELFDKIGKISHVHTVKRIASA